MGLLNLFTSLEARKSNSGEPDNQIDAQFKKLDTSEQEDQWCIPNMR
jgi:hypothetical protein